MQTITQKKKLSKGTWALIFILIATFIAVVVLAVVGYISLAFLADWATGTMMFGSTGWVNATLVLAVPFVLGVFFCYVVYRYFIGQKVSLAANTGGYTPQGQGLSNPQQSGNETVIS
jgi:ABC-type uncharacterized transport system permease subunit